MHTINLTEVYQRLSIENKFQEKLLVVNLIEARLKKVQELVSHEQKNLHHLIEADHVQEIEIKHSL